MNAHKKLVELGKFCIILQLGLLEMFVTMGGAVIGAMFYLTVNRWIDEKTSREEDPSLNDAEKAEAPQSEKSDESTPLRKQSLAKSRWKKIAKERLGVIDLLRREHIEGRRGRDKALCVIAA